MTDPWPWRHNASPLLTPTCSPTPTFQGPENSAHTYHPHRVHWWGSCSGPEKGRRRETLGQGEGWAARDASVKGAGGKTKTLEERGWHGPPVPRWTPVLRHLPRVGGSHHPRLGTPTGPEQPWGGEGSGCQKLPRPGSGQPTAYTAPLRKSEKGASPQHFSLDKKKFAMLVSQNR